MTVHEIRNTFSTEQKRHETLKHMQKMHLKMLSALVAHCIYLIPILTNCKLVHCMESNSVDPDQPPLTGSTLLVEEASYTFQQTTKQTIFAVIGALNVNLF